MPSKNWQSTSPTMTSELVLQSDQYIKLPKIPIANGCDRNSCPRMISRKSEPSYIMEWMESDLTINRSTSQVQLSNVLQTDHKRCSNPTNGLVGFVLLEKTVNWSCTSDSKILVKQVHAKDAMKHEKSSKIITASQVNFWTNIVFQILTPQKCHSFLFSITWWHQPFWRFHDSHHSWLGIQSNIIIINIFKDQENQQTY